MASAELIEPIPYGSRPLTPRERRVLRKCERRIAREERRWPNVIGDLRDAGAFLRDTKTFLTKYGEERDARLTEAERRRERTDENLHAVLYTLACTTLVVLVVCWASIRLS